MRLTVKINIIIAIIILAISTINIMFIQGCGSNDDLNIGSVKGQLIDINGGALTGKKMQILGINGTVGIAYVDTNIEGRFSFINVPIGDYTLTGTEQDYTFIASKNVTILKKQIIEVTIQQGEVAPPTPTPTVTGIGTQTSPTVTATPVPTFI